MLGGRSPYVAFIPACVRSITRYVAQLVAVSLFTDKVCIVGLLPARQSAGSVRRFIERFAG